jgi:hypothetical protein
MFVSSQLAQLLSAACCKSGCELLLFTAVNVVPSAFTTSGANGEKTGDHGTGGTSDDPDLR